jgi:two-component system response regulator FlrC
MRLLIVGTLNGQLTTATKLAMDKGATVTHATDIAQALAVLRSGRGADLLMVDVAIAIRELVSALEAEHIHAPIVACGTATDARAAVAAIQAGAKEYIPLPPDPELIAAVLAAVADDTRQLIYRDEAMARVVKLALQIAPSDASILITGESGTGKEVVARYVHARSNRAKKPFISLNCAAIPETLLESELFGHEKGAFTGAVARRIGKFEEANGGTLLLDEISEMDVRLQAKLLRAIQERVIDRLGGARPVPVDIRIIATSNRNLADAVRQNTFREDLLFRLNVVNLKIPPLRDRPADVLELAQYFVGKYAVANGLPARPLSQEARRTLTVNLWPGNVRELENTIHRAVLLTSGIEIGADSIIAPDGGRLDQQQHNASSVAHAALAAEQVSRALVGRTVAEVERDLILETLKHCLGNRTHAANVLGISIRTLRNKLNEYAADGVPVPPPGGGEPRAAAKTIIRHSGLVRSAKSGIHIRLRLKTGAEYFPS